MTAQTYEAWRISYQSSEQAARAAYAMWQEAQAQRAPLEEKRILEIADKHRTSYPSCGFDFEEFDEVGFCRDLEGEFGIKQEPSK